MKSLGSVRLGPQGAHRGPRGEETGESRYEGKQKESPGPQLRLSGEPDKRFEQQRVAGETDEGARVRERVEPVHVGSGRFARSRAASARQPCRDQRSGRSEREKGRPQGHEEREEDPARRGLPARGRPVGSGDRRKTEQGGQTQNDCVDRHLDPRREPGNQQMRVEISAQEDCLEEEERHGPDHGRPSVPGEQAPRCQRLHDEEQQRAQENGGAGDPDSAHERRGGLLR